MPIYEYECKEHGRFEAYYGINSKPRQVSCTTCGATAPFVFSAPAIQPDKYWNGHYSEALGKNFTSKTEFNKYLKSNNLVPYESGMKEQIASNKKSIEDKKDVERRKFITEQVSKF